MGKTKPKYSARNIVDYHPIDQAVIDKIKQGNPNINFDETEGAIENLKRACGLFLAKRMLYSSENKVRRSNKIAALKAMLLKGKGAGPLPALIDMLKNMDPHTKSFLKLETKLADFSDPLYEDHFTIEELVMKLEILNDEVVKGYKKLNRDEKDSGGRPPNQSLHDFLDDLKPIYEKCTGKRATRVYNAELGEGGGPFPEFALSCMRALGLGSVYSLKTIFSATQHSKK